MKWLVLLLIPFPAYSECYTDIGIAIHSNNFDTGNKPQRNRRGYMENPIGVLNYECKTDSGVYFINHASSIPDNHDKGLTMLGIKARF